MLQKVNSLAEAALKDKKDTVTKKEAGKVIANKLNTMSLMIMRQGVLSKQLRQVHDVKR
jgi:hypothetical protein